MSENGSPAHLVSPGRSLGIGAALLAGAAALVAIGVTLGVRVADNGFAEQHWWLAALLLVGLVDAGTGAVLLNRLPRRRIAWCLLIGGVAAVLAVVLATSPHYSAAIGRAPGWDEIDGTESWARPLAAGVLVALLPWELAARERRRHWELAWWTTAALVVATVVGEAAGAQVPGIDVVDVATWLVAASATAATTLLLVDWYRSRGRSEDALLGWVAAGAVVAWLAVVPERIGIEGWHVPASHVIGPLLLIATVPLLVVGVVVRAMRERPGRFHGVAHDVIGWLVLSAAIVAVYTGVVAGLGRFLGGNGSTWLLVATTGAVAISVEPARRRVRTTVDRLVWGVRDDPLTVVRGVVDHVGADTDGELLPALAASLRRELRLDGVTIDVRTPDGWRRAAAVGGPTAHDRTVPLVQHDEEIGRLVVGWDQGPHLRARDERVLAEVAGPLALAVGWVCLASELRRSTAALASAREEERRRLRRDLHDGLGPALTGVSLGLRTALHRLERSGAPAAATTSHELLRRTADEVDALVVEVKRIVRDLRPTVLDRLGLVEAIAAFTRTFEEQVELHVTLPGAPTGLPVAVEVAVYRIVTEAVTNVVRHAEADRCWLTVAVEPDAAEVRIEVVDDGTGIGPGSTAGVGWTAMRERAGELGGTVRIGPRDPHGTVVHVRIPLAAT
jgi:signal transduction histidine kinase